MMSRYSFRPSNIHNFFNFGRTPSQKRQCAINNQKLTNWHKHVEKKAILTILNNFKIRNKLRKGQFRLLVRLLALRAGREVPRIIFNFRKRIRDRWSEPQILNRGLGVGNPIVSYDFLDPQLGNFHPSDGALTGDGDRFGG